MEILIFVWIIRIISIITFGLGAVLLLGGARVARVIFSEKIANSFSVPSMFWTVVIIRLGLGIMFLLLASASPYPITFSVVGALSTFSGLLVFVLGPKTFPKLVNMVYNLFHSYPRPLAAPIAAIGLLLMYIVFDAKTML